MPRMRQGLVRATVLIAALGCRAYAGEDNEATALAQRLYQQGLTAYKEGRYDDAVRDLRKAHLLNPAPRILLNLAVTHRQRGDDTEALAYYRRFLAEAPPTDTQRAVADKAIAAIEAERKAASKAASKARGGQPADPPVAPRRFAHVPVDAMRPEAPLRLWAYLSVPPPPPGGAPTAARVYLRRPGEARFEPIEMRRPGTDSAEDEVVAELPPALTGARTFQYYIEVRDGTGALLKTSGTGLRPHVVQMDALARYRGERPAAWQPDAL